MLSMQDISKGQKSIKNKFEHKKDLIQDTLSKTC